MGTQAKDETFNLLDVLFKESVRYRINGRIDKVFYTPRHNSVCPLEVLYRNSKYKIRNTINTIKTSL